MSSYNMEFLKTTGKNLNFLRGDMPAPAKKKLKICCACPATKKIRDACIAKNGEDNCLAEIEAHTKCLRAEGFNV